MEADEPSQQANIILNFQVHESNCVYRPTRCHNCSQFIMCKEMEEHLSKLCPKLTVECKTCHHQIQLTNLDNHKHICGTASNCCPECGESLDASVGLYSLS